MTFVRPQISAMRGYEPGEQPPPGKFVKLNTNENPYPASPRVATAIAAAVESGLARYPNATATPFRQRAGRLLGVDPDWILCGNGSDDLLTILTRTFVSEGQLLRLPYPSYVLYRTLAEIQGARHEEVTFNQDWTLPETFGDSASNPSLVFLPNPNSPSGTVLPPAKVLEFASRLPCPLVVDEAYAEFSAENCLDLVHQSDRIIVMRTLSKSYSLAGLRFGYLVARPEVVAECLKVKDSYNCGSLAIAGATAAIDDQEWLAENCRKIVATRERMTGQLRQMGFQVPASQANFVWCQLPDQPVRPIYENLKRQHVLVRYMNYANWGEGLRISVGSDEQVDACLYLLKEVVKK